METKSSHFASPLSCECVTLPKSQTGRNAQIDLWTSTGELLERLGGAEWRLKQSIQGTECTDEGCVGTPHIFDRDHSLHAEFADSSQRWTVTFRDPFLPMSFHNQSSCLIVHRLPNLLFVHSQSQENKLPISSNYLGLFVSSQIAFIYNCEHRNMNGSLVRTVGRRYFIRTKYAHKHHLSKSTQEWLFLWRSCLLALLFVCVLAKFIGSHTPGQKDVYCFSTETKL